MTHRGTNTVVTSIAAADDNNVLAFRIDVFAILKLRIKERLGVHLQKFSVDFV